MSEDSVRLLLVDVSENVDIVRMKAGLVRLVDVSREQGKADSEGNTKPEVRGVEQEMVVSIYRCDKPSG